jgi:hypothetical protein
MDLAAGPARTRSLGIPPLRAEARRSPGSRTGRRCRARPTRSRPRCGPPRRQASSCTRPTTWGVRRREAAVTCYSDRCEARPVRRPLREVVRRDGLIEDVQGRSLGPYEDRPRASSHRSRVGASRALPGPSALTGQHGPGGSSVGIEAHPVDLARGCAASSCLPHAWTAERRPRGRMLPDRMSRRERRLACPARTVAA